MNARLAHLLSLRSGRDGFIIVAVLWILAALATLVTIFSMYVINTATAFTVHDERLQAEGLARAALELSVYRATAAPQGQTATRGTFLFRLGTALVNEAKRLSPDGVTLLVNTDNARAIRFYRRNGFIDAGGDVNPTSGKPVLRMAWKP